MSKEVQPPKTAEERAAEAVALTRPMPTRPEQYSYKMLKFLAKDMVESGIFGLRDERAAFALMMLCKTDGIDPVNAMRDYHFIEGKPSMKAEAMLRRFQAAGGKVQYLQHNDDVVKAEFTAPDGTKLTHAWTVDKAKQAGVYTKKVWQSYSCAMLRNRVISEGIRSVYPAVLGGMYTGPEVIGYADKGKPLDDPDVIDADDLESAVVMAVERSQDVAVETAIEIELDEEIEEEIEEEEAPPPKRETRGRKKGQPAKPRRTDAQIEEDGERAIADSLVDEIRASENLGELRELLRQTLSMENEEQKQRIQEEHDNRVAALEHKLEKGKTDVDTAGSIDPVVVNTWVGVLLPLASIYKQLPGQFDAKVQELRSKEIPDAIYDEIVRKYESQRGPEDPSIE